MKYILSIDQGTTSSRAILFDHAGAMLGVAQQEFEQHFPKPGWVEHDPAEIWSSQLRVIRDVLKKTGAMPDQLAAIGITNQRETAIAWDRTTGEALCPAIVWQDRRTAPRCDELKAGGKEALIREKTGLVADAYFSATKWEWMLRNVQGLKEKAGRGEVAFGTVDSWLIFKLTGGRAHVTDATNASRTLLYNIHTLAWDEELLEIFGIPASALPTVHSSSEIYATTDPALLGTAVPIAGIAGDQQAATFGQMCLEPGTVKCTYGTGCFILCNTGEKAVHSESNLLTTIAWQIGDKTVYALEGSIFIGGAVVQWLRDGLGLVKESSEIEALAASVEDNGGVYFVPAFTGLGAPHWDPYARGMIAGLTRGVTSGHIARAALESIAFQVNDVVGAMEDDANTKIRELKVDGGAVVNNLLMQFQADLLGLPVIRPRIIETTALGAAYLAGLAVGFWKSVEEISAQWAEDRTFHRTIDRPKQQELLDAWHRAISRAKNWEH
ncbi:MAG: glycerol kinase GlpK [Bacteroidales bacterium]